MERGPSDLVNQGLSQMSHLSSLTPMIIIPALEMLKYIQNTQLKKIVWINLLIDWKKKMKPQKFRT